MTFREEIIGDCRLILGDCREWLSLVPRCFRVHAVITDPPYGVGFKYESHVDDPDAYPEFMRGVVSQIENVRGDGPAVFWQGMLNADRWHEWFPKGFRLFAACKGFVQYLPTQVQFSWDPVVFWGDPKTHPSVDKKDWHVQSLAPFGAGRTKIEHPCPRPVEQVQYVVELFTRFGDVVLDPFMGSGTTGVACAVLGRRFIGIEIEPNYYEVALRRIEAAYRQPDLFIQSEPKQTAPEPSLFEGEAA